MALFGGKKNTQAQSTDDSKAASASTSAVLTDVEDVLLHPRVTEKAVLGTQDRTYVFQVHEDATKRDIARAVERVYKVTPRKVNVAFIPKKQTSRRRIRGMKGGGKKAYVYLKEGDKIDLT